MRWANKSAIPLAAYTTTQTSSVLSLEPSDVANGVYVFIRPTVAGASWNCNIQMPPLATGVFGEISNLDDCCADLNMKGIFIANSVIITKIPKIKIIFEQAGALEVTAEVFIMSAID